MMLLQILTHQPQLLGTIVQRTPSWVWGLLTALLALGATQLARRQAGMLRVGIMPIAMTLFALYGLATAFAGSHLWIGTLALWLATAAAGTALALWRWPNPPAGTRFDALTARFELPGSVRPLALIVGIFLLKYLVGVELALQPAQAHDPGFALGVAALYGACTSLFAARLVRLWRLSRLRPVRATLQPATAPAALPSPPPPSS